MKATATTPARLAALALCATLAACEPPKPPEPVQVIVTWLTDRVPPAKSADAFRQELGEWFAPFIAPQPCDRRFYFSVSMTRNEGGKGGTPLELLTQKEAEILKQDSGFMKSIFPPGFLDIQEKAKAQIATLALPDALFAPKTPVASPAALIESARQAKKPALILYMKNVPASAAQAASAAASAPPVSLGGKAEAFQAKLVEAFCPAPVPAGSSSRPADKEQPLELNTNVLLIEAPDDNFVAPPPPPPAPEPASAPATAPPPTAASAPPPSHPPSAAEAKQKVLAPTEHKARKPPPPQEKPQDQAPAEDTRRINEAEIRPLPKHEVPK